MFKKLATDQQSLRMRCYVTTRLLVPQSAKGSWRCARLGDPLLLQPRRTWLPFLLQGPLVLAGTLGRILCPNYPGRKTRLSRRPLGNTHHRSLQITSLCGCATSFKRVTLTVACHWRGLEQQRAGERGAGGGVGEGGRGGGGGRRRVGRLGETPELQTQQERAARVQSPGSSPWPPPRTPPPR